jgi:RNA polymerase sigma factor (sigma-70 family)
LLKILPQDEQNLLFMRYRVGLTHKEIANMLELPEGTVRRQSAAILKKLKTQWQEDADDI